MSTVIIGFSSPKSWKLGAEFIKLWQGGTKFSHVYMRVYSNYTEQWLVYQASHGFVNCLTYANFSSGNKICKEFSVDIEPEKLKNTIKIAQQLLGRPYGYLGLIKLGLRRFGIKWAGDDMHSFHCSELIATLFPEFIANMDSDYVEPVHLFNVLQSMEGKPK